MPSAIFQFPFQTTLMALGEISLKKPVKLKAGVRYIAVVSEDGNARVIRDTKRNRQRLEREPSQPFSIAPVVFNG